MVNFFNWSRRDEVIGTRVLVCSSEDSMSAIGSEDARIWQRHYPATTSVTASSIDELCGILDQGYDVIHLLWKTDSEGTFLDSNIRGTNLIEQCCDADVKLLWIACDNDPQAYIKGFSARGKRINLVMTIDRRGAVFSSFLDRLLAKTAYGDTLPVAWNQLCPQAPDLEHSDAPACIFFAGRGGVLLR
jgi:hypothetical protein